MAEPNDRSVRTGPRQPGGRTPSLLRRGAVAVGLTVLALIVGGVLVLVFSGALDQVTVWTVVLGIVLAELGYGVTGVVFVALTGNGADFLGLDVPFGTGRLATYVVGGAVVLFTFRSIVFAGATVVGVPLTPLRLAEVPIDWRTFALALIPLSVFVVGPCEELFFRGVVQQYLDGAISTRGAILGAGVLFTAVHVPTYLTFSALGAAVSLAVVFVVGLGLGYLYERSGSLVVPIGVHGLYNSLIMGSALVLAELGVV